MMQKIENYHVVFLFCEESLFIFTQITIKHLSI